MPLIRSLRTINWKSSFKTCRYFWRIIRIYAYIFCIIFLVLEAWIISLFFCKIRGWLRIKIWFFAKMMLLFSFQLFWCFNRFFVKRKLRSWWILIIGVWRKMHHWSFSCFDLRCFFLFTMLGCRNSLLVIWISVPIKVSTWFFRLSFFSELLNYCKLFFARATKTKSSIFIW